VSIRLLSAAWDLDIPSTEKMVLMCLCDHANDDGVCWPSVETLCRKTSKGERTVQAALKWLHDHSYFEFRDGEHKARTYYLDPCKICAPPPQELRPAKSAPRKSRTPQNLRPTPAKSAPHPRRFCAQTTIEPSMNLSEAKASSKRARGKSDFILPDWVPADAWVAFLEMRRGIRKPLTDHAKQLAVNKLDQLARDGHPPGDVLNQSTMNCWQGLFEIKETKHGNQYSGRTYRDTSDGGRPSGWLG